MESKQSALLLALCVFFLSSCGALDTANSVTRVPQTRQVAAAYPFPGSTTTLNSLDVTKEAAVTQQTQVVEVEAARPTRSTPYVFRPHPTMQPILRPTGVSDDCESADSFLLIHRTNCWSGVAGGMYFDMFAGESNEQPGYGVIILLDSNDIITHYITPQATGRITLTSVQTIYFIFQTEAGSTTIFDVATRQWMGEVPTYAASN